MDKQVATVSWEAIPELPVVALTRSGVELYPREDIWVYRDITMAMSLNFTAWPATASFVTSAKLTLLWYAAHMSPSHVKNMFERLGHYVRTMCANRDTPLAEINSHDLISYRSMLSDNTLWYLGNMSGFLQRWCALGYPGVTADAVSLLKQIRTRGNRKGEAVLTHDPFRGPFTDIEWGALQSALDRAHVDGEVDREVYLLTYLFMALGQRSVQYASLKLCDVGVACAQDGTVIYTLRVPRAKQRNQLSRAEFKDRVLVSHVGEILVRHRDDVYRRFQRRLSDPSRAPLFPARRQSGSCPDGFEYHRTGPSLGLMLRAGLCKLSAMSERTGRPLHVTAVRFRRTVATRAAMEGHGELIIAELLDHTDTQNVGVYIEARPEILERIDRALALQLAPMAQAFAGMIILDESHARRAGDPSSRVCDPRFDPSMKPMGNCGKHGFCGFFAPIACYTCVNFQPWADGPHEDVLAFLLGERDRLASQTDMRIASVNDRTILAVAEVVRRCEEIRSGKADCNG
ncbi:site-specific integrase [Pseudomonas aeruginosa]|uniref:site-specific integrase n=1 Tax=Pseudomonas aeruginosa TaxID=287 RepID=UPI00236321DC|nr:site-specific integrase [Pseudomonas aeruginosa]